MDNKVLVITAAQDVTLICQSYAGKAFISLYDSISTPSESFNAVSTILTQQQILELTEKLLSLIE